MLLTLLATAVRAPVIPLIGSIEGVHLGWTIKEELIPIYGEPFKSVGGHPDGRWTWTVNGNLLSVEHFDYSERGSVVHDVLVKLDPAGEAVRVARWQLSGGFTREKCKSLLAPLGEPKVNVEGTLKWSATGVAWLSNQMQPYREWELELRFQKDRLVVVHGLCQ